MFMSFLSHQQEWLMMQIHTLEKKLKQFPKENLLCEKNGPYVKWYKSNGAHPVYIPKKQKSYAERLAVKKLYSVQLEELKKKLKVTEELLKYKDKAVYSDVEALLSEVGYGELLKNYFQDHPTYMQQWIQERYVQNSLFPENLIHETHGGQLVRSKSEVMIANTLYRYKIPFRYECEMSLGSSKFYPDFTILHPQTEQIIYWEHFGMMDHQTYRDGAFNKMKIYGDYNIIPSINLITTYETQSRPINSNKIEQIVEEYFGGMMFG